LCVKVRPKINMHTLVHSPVASSPSQTVSSLEEIKKREQPFSREVYIYDPSQFIH
jgi:hypothetical protein